jgi:hypothetical protein
MKYLNWRKISLGLLSILLLAQFIRPTKNLSGDDTYTIHKKYALPEDVAQTLKVACDDCHSNKSAYPWYAEIQPVAWWIQNHINDGKRHLNFSTLASKPTWLQFHKMEEVQEQIEKGEMPMKSYTWIHSDAKLSESQKQAIVNWSKIVRDSMRANFPPDSLKRPPRKENKK